MSFSQGASSGSSHSSKSKLNQVVQNFFSKATQVVVQSRLGPRQRDKSHKLNKWFNLETDELEAFRDDLKLWRTIDIYSDKMPPVVVETYLDMRHLNANQTLVLEDLHGKRWNASFGGRKTEVVLERWVIEIQRPESPQQSPASSTELPMAYKKCILLFRALYTYCRLLPAWTLQKKLAKSKLSASPLKIGCRVLNGAQPISSRGRVGLSKPVSGGSAGAHLGSFSFDPVEIPSGVFKISVSYRTNCSFAVDDSEAMLSSQFLRIDESSELHSAAAAAASTAAVVHPSPPVKHPSMTAPNLHYITGGLPRRHSSTSSSSAAVVPSSVSSMNDDLISEMANRRKSSGSISRSSGRSLGSPDVEDPGTSASPASPPVPRVPSSSSLAALRIPRRTISNSSAGSGRVATTPGYTPSAYEQAISSSGGSSRSGSVPKYSSSFGTRQWNRSGSISSSKRRNSMLVGSHTSAESVMSSGSSLMEPGSGFIDIEDPTDLSDFVKMVDSVKPGSSSPYSLPSPRKNDPLARFQQLKGSHAGIADSITSSSISSSMYPHPTPPYYYSSSQSPTHAPIVPSKLSGEQHIVRVGKEDGGVLVEEEGSQLVLARPPPRPATANPLQPVQVPPSPKREDHKHQPVSLADEHTSEYQQLRNTRAPEHRPHSYSERDYLGNNLSSNNVHYKALERYDLGGVGGGSRYYCTEEDTSGHNRYSVRDPLPGLDFDEDDDLLFAMSDMNIKQ